MKKSLGFKNSSYRRQGIALVTVLILLVIITTLVTISTLLALGNRNSSTDTIQTTRAQTLAEAGIEKALDTVFFETYRRWVIGGEGGTGTKFDLCAFRKWLTGYWSGSSITAQKDPAKLTANNNNNCIYTGSVNAAKPNRASVGLDAPSFPDLLNGATQSLPDISKTLLPALSADGSDYAVSVSVTRVDNGDDINLTFVSTSVIKNGTQELSAKKITRTLNFSGSPFPGDEFALLTNDINCSFCHLQIDNMKRVYADPASPEVFKRIKMGALTGIDFKDVGHKNDSLIAGTLYSRGTAAPAVGVENYFAPWASASQPGLVKAGVNNSVAAGVAAAKYTAALAPNGYDPALIPDEVKVMDASVAGALPKGKLYIKYPTQASGVTPPDGIVPDAFPTIITDSNSDGLLSDSDWSSYIVGAPRGSLVSSGAVIYGVRRPSSVNVGGDIPISYDPIAANPQFTGSRIGDVFVAGNFWAGAGKAVGAAMTQALLNADILRLNTLTSTWATAYAVNPASGATAAALTPMTAAENSFRNQWRGWLLQQALASPNNRDLLPTNGTTNPVAGFQALVAPNAAGITQQNFWTAFNPTNSTFYLAYCRLTPCRVLTAGTATNPENGVRNTSIIPGAAALSPDLAVLALPLTNADDLFPAASNSAANDVLSGTNSLVSGLFDGNLIIDAGRIGDNNATQRFVTITGTVHVNGDLVIRGQVKGEGRFIVRGNVYVVGDMVYGCTVSACMIVDGANPSYRKPEGLPKLALLAGGSIIVGDYDHPDFRANRSQYNLINDQVGQSRQPTVGNTTSWQMQTVPGATGTNMTQNNGGNMGFAPMNAAFGNSHTNVRFASAPFGFMVRRNGGFGAYESGGTTVGAAELGSYTIQTLYPSNGPMRIGDSSANGFSVAPVAGGVISNAAMRCINAANVGFLPNIPTVFDATLNSLNSGFWCPPTAGQYVRNWGTTGPTPATAGTNTWMNQPTANAGLDGGVGMSTGWLGGLLRTNQAGAGFDQLGDLSQTKLIKLLWMSTMENTVDRDPNIAGVQSVSPLRTDGLLYSRNSLFCVARYYADQRNGAAISNTQGRWIHNGSVLSYELGFLLTGNVNQSATVFTTTRTTAVDFTPAIAAENNNRGPSMGVFYDERLSGILGISGGALEIRRTGVFTQAGR
jgi:hypothetical protein